MRDLQLERTTHISAARSIIDGAKAADRDLTSTEDTTVRGHLDAVTDLDKQIKGRAMVQSVLGLTRPRRLRRPRLLHRRGQDRHPPRRRNPHGLPHRGRFQGRRRPGTLLPPSGQFVEGGLHPNSQFPLISLFANQAATGPTQRYYRTTAGVAEVVAEGGLKPDAAVSFAAVDMALSKLACTANFSDELQEDSGFLLATLQQELVAAVTAAQNKLVIDTFAATVGVLTRTGVAATVVDLVADSIAAQESISGLTPSAIIAHPSVIATIRKAKASTAGSYMVDPLSAVPTTCTASGWSPAPPPGRHQRLGRGRPGVVVYTRGPITVELGHNDTDWVHNTRPRGPNSGSPSPSRGRPRWTRSSSRRAHRIVAPVSDS